MRSTDQPTDLESEGFKFTNGERAYSSGRLVYDDELGGGGGWLALHLHAG